jgi:hypothetical protein
VLREQSVTAGVATTPENAMSAKKIPAAARQQLDKIATAILGMETLETRHSDRLDFHDTAVWSIKAALEAAYLAGIADRKGGAA